MNNKMKNFKIQWIENKINTENITTSKARRERKMYYIGYAIKYKIGMNNKEVLDNIYHEYCLKDNRIKEEFLKYKKLSRDNQILWNKYKQSIGWSGCSASLNCIKQKTLDEHRKIYDLYEKQKKQEKELFELLVQKQQDNYKEDILNFLKITENEMSETLSILEA